MTTSDTSAISGRQAENFHFSNTSEDNKAALYVATANPPFLTTWNKHWNIKHHWFHSHLGEGKDCIKILPIPTQDQWADISQKL